LAAYDPFELGEPAFVGGRPDHDAAPARLAGGLEHELVDPT